MSGLARLLMNKGYKVSGSDIRENAIIKELKQNNIDIDVPHRAGSVKDKDLVCFSSAIKGDNPEIQAARAVSIPLVKRGVLLGQVLKNEDTIAVAGSHGKTTVTSLASFVLKSLGKDIASMVGGIPRYSNISSWWGKDMFVVETDESDASFLYIKPSYAVITNIDKEHVSFYKSFAKLIESFKKFSQSAQRLIVACGDDELLLKILKKNKKKTLTYGLKPQNIFGAKDLNFTRSVSSFTLIYNGQPRLKVKIPLLGRHNIQNCLAVIALCKGLGFGFEEIAKAIAEFPGTRRRLEFKGNINEVEFVDDYAHHPSEIKAVLQAVRIINPDRLVVLFQPHRFSRVKNLVSEFARCFEDADLLVVTDIYSAGEKEIEGIDSQWFYKRITKTRKKESLYIAEKDLANKTPGLLNPGDFFLALGAGNINNIQDEIMKVYGAVQNKSVICDG